MKTGFDRFAEFLTSIRAVILAMICLLLFLMIETQTLFNRQLPDDVFPALRILASFAVAIVFEMTVLIFTANASHRGKYQGPDYTVPKILAWFHFIINLHFWQAWDFANHRDLVDSSYRFFLSALFSYLGYIYAALFVRKYEERKQELRDLQETDRILAEAAELRSAYDQVSSAYDQVSSGVGELKSK
ncbi:MAG: hypothetical protein HC831_08295 [Chloroflexia bacterium]|nr:hypothetical protein [Chloroflexia bacterium]